MTTVHTSAMHTANPPAAIADIETESMPVKAAPLQSLIAAECVEGKGGDADLHALALQIQHNLQYQHAWTALSLHTHSPLTGAVLPRPLLSGLPPQRLYVHPDEQIELLKEADRARKARQAKKAGRGEGAEAPEGLEVKVEPEREWVLPARLCEKWTLRRLSEVFESIGVLPPGGEKEGNKWRTDKRVLLGTADEDSTVVYYIIHDGVVKPRQN